MSVYHRHALLAGLSIILGEAKSFIFMAVSVSESGRKKKCSIQQKKNDGIALLIIFFYYLIQKVGRRLCSLLYQQSPTPLYFRV